MLNITKLLEKIPKEFIHELTLSEDCEIDLDCREAYYDIKKGNWLRYGENKFTQLSKPNDPTDGA